MSLFSAWSAASAARDAEAMIALLHEEYTFVRHQSGTTMNKAEMAGMLRGLMSSDAVVVHSQRCLYENDEVLVEHSVIDFADGTTEAVLSFYRLKEGQILHAESGASLIAKPQ